ncbi:hypothetical protein FACS1894178_8990 [Bacteroidia bacterium]|nr:hypothetical protein FACS1894178_8990 [Bacteroidia bacterium]
MIMKKAKYILLVIVFCPLFSVLHAQNIEANFSCDSTHYEVGDHIRLSLQVSVPKNVNVFFPQFVTDSLGENVEIISQGKIDTLSKEKDAFFTVKQNVTMVIFAAGEYNFPAMPILVNKKGDSGIDSIFTNTLTLQITAPEVDMEANIKDIKDIWRFPLTFKEILPYASGFLLLCLIIAIVVFVYIRRKNKIPIFRLKPKPVVPPHIVAFERLEKLKQSQLWQQSLVKEYYSELTDILREYIEKALNIPAIEMTSEELLNKMRSEKMKSEEMKMVQEILNTADLAKFAKYQPYIDEHDNCYKLVKKFVEDTLVQVQPAQV